MSIYEDFIVYDDKYTIEDWANKKNIKLLTIRKTGKASVGKLELGAGAKPHNILDKSISKKKDKEKNEAITNFFEKTGLKDYEDFILGLIGHWGYENGRGKYIDGLYLTSIGKMEYSKNNNPLKKYIKYEKNNSPHGEKEQGEPYLLLYNYNKQEGVVGIQDEVIEYLKKQIHDIDIKKPNINSYLFYRNFYAGDYDVHDLIQSNQAVVSSLDVKLLKDLQNQLFNDRIDRNKNILGLDYEKYLNVEQKMDYQRVQHGVQYNYIAQMLEDNKNCMNLERFSVIVEKVAYHDDDELLVMYRDNHGIEWFVGKFDDIRKKYINVKWTWDDKGYKDIKEKYIFNSLNRMLNSGKYGDINNFVIKCKEKIPYIDYEYWEWFKREVKKKEKVCI